MAVIVILAIIALIAVPIILNIIGSSKKSAVVRSGELYLKAVETAIARENLNSQFNPTSCAIGTDGNLTCVDKDSNEINLTIEVKGSKPTSGTINLNKGKIISIEQMILDRKILEKSEGGKLVLNELPQLNPQGTYLMRNNYVESADTYFLGQEKIKRNQVESISVTYTKKVPSKAIHSWDVSAAQDGSIMAWYTDKDNNNLYELYIGGEDGVKANPRSLNLFSYFINTISIDLEYLDTSDVTIMDDMFKSCTNLIDVNLKSFNTSQVTSMQSMFSECKNLATLDVSNFDTSRVTFMTYMFYYCSKLKELNLNSFDTSNVTTMYGMFWNSSELSNLDLSSFDVSNVTTMGSMFNGCSGLKVIKVKDVFTQEFINSRLADSNRTNVIVEIVA